MRNEINIQKWSEEVLHIKPTKPSLLSLNSFIQKFCEFPQLCRSQSHESKYLSGALPPGILAQFLRPSLPAEWSFPREFWIGQSQAEVFGTIGANVSPINPERGYIGFFEMKIDTPFVHSEKLIDLAKAWLYGKGVKTIYAPVNFNTWFPYRWSAPSFLKTSFFPWEPIAPPEYSDLFQKKGFQISARYHSQGLEGLDFFISDTKQNYETCLESGFQFRKVQFSDEKKISEEELMLIYEISQKGFQSNFLFEEIPYSLFKNLYLSFADKMDYDYTYFALSPEGRAIGFFFAFEDQDYIVLKSASILTEFRGKGLSNAMAYLILSKAQKKGLSKFITALVHHGIQSESYGKKSNLIWNHDYFLYSIESKR